MEKSCIKYPSCPNHQDRQKRRYVSASPSSSTSLTGRQERALTPRLNQAISSRHDFLHLRQKRGREIDDMKAILLLFGHLSKLQHSSRRLLTVALSTPTASAISCCVWPGQCTRDSNRDIARQCETAGRSPLKRTIANHTETPNRRRATRPARNISQHSRNPPRPVGDAPDVDAIERVFGTMIQRGR